MSQASGLGEVPLESLGKLLLNVGIPVAEGWEDLGNWKEAPNCRHIVLEVQAMIPHEAPSTFPK